MVQLVQEERLTPQTDEEALVSLRREKKEEVVLELLCIDGYAVRNWPF